MRHLLRWLARREIREAEECMRLLLQVDCALAIITATTKGYVEGYADAMREMERLLKGRGTLSLEDVKDVRKRSVH